MTIDKKKKILSEVPIPARPEILVQVTDAFKENEQPNLALIAQLVGKDVGLSAAILQVVNSPFFGLSNKISSIQQALALLGIKKILMLVRSVSVRNVSKNASKLTDFWDTANEIANICVETANLIKLRDRDDVFSLGLFHACGVPIMMEHFSDYADFYASAYSNERSLIELETQRYEINHAQISGLLCRNWFLPSDIIVAVENYHRPFSVLLSRFPEHQSKLTMIAILKASIGINYQLNKMHRQNVSVGTHWARDYKDVLGFLGISETDFVSFEDFLLDKFNQ